MLEIQKEVAREVNRFLRIVFQERRTNGRIDLDAVETALRSAMHQAGACVLTQLLQFDPPNADHRTIPCPCGHLAHYKELRSKTVLTILGPVQLRRPYYLCADCSKGRCPVDAELDLDGLESSPGVRRMEAVVGSEMPFATGCDPMKLLAGLDLTAKAIERASEAIGSEIGRRNDQEIERTKKIILPVIPKQNIPKMYVLMDGVHVPVVAAEAEGRTSKIDGERAHTRECKLGCVFTQTTVDEDGWAVRDPGSTTYVGAIETAEEFGFRIYTEAWLRGWQWATTKIVIGDGAPWIWNRADQHFPGAIQIVDLYHARQHLSKIAALLHPNDTAAQKLWLASMKDDLLDKGKIEPLVTQLLDLAATNAEAEDLAKELIKEADYFATNAERMRYPEFREKGLFVGSGVVEAGCKSVIGSRLKRSGMFWTVRGANSIIALRCCRFNGRFEDYWEQDRAA